MQHNDTVVSPQQRWAQLRFSIIGGLLAAPPDNGELQKALRRLAEQHWRNPISGGPVQFSFATIERWYYRARAAADPVAALRPRVRRDAGKLRQLPDALAASLKQQYEAHKGWSCQLHVDNLKVMVAAQPELGPMPSYSTIRRYMKAQGWHKLRRVRQRETAGTRAADQRLQHHEVRSYEVDYVHGLWHLDFHHGSRKIITRDGRWVTPLLLAVMDDRSRVICHAQWYLDETTESLVHGVAQAIQKRALPRALMSDNGAAMIAAEFTEGLTRLGIVHKTTLPYSPYQNGKQENLWALIEGRLLAMLEGEAELTLTLLNRATQAWVEREYHHRLHSELGATPMQRYLEGPDVGRDSPDSQTLQRAFRMQARRKQRRSDGTISLEGQRFEVPSAYRSLEQVHLQYARWDLRQVDLVDPRHETILCRLHPLDKSANANARRRRIEVPAAETTVTSNGIAPLLKQLMADYAETGLPPAYVPKEEKPS